MIVTRKPLLFLQTSVSVRLNMIQAKNGQAEKNNGTSNTINDVDWPGLRAAAVAIGIRKAARQAARDLPPDEQE